MKALAASTYRSLDGLAFTELPDPVPGPGELLVRVEATSLNPVDVKMLRGDLRSLFETPFPYVPGADLAGRVVAVGAGVKGYAIGDRVGGLFHAGLAELARASAASPLIARVPEALTSTVAAAAPVVGLAALGAMESAGDIRGRKIAVIGATGAVGSLVVQLAHAAGATVIATAKPPDATYVRGFGASETIDYGSQPAIDEIKRRYPEGVDVIVDLVSVGPALTATGSAVRPGGVLVSTLFGADEAALAGRIALRYVRMDEGGSASLEQLYGMLAGGDLRLDIGATYPFDRSAEALEALVAGGVRGKIVVTF
jgi:NADPH:quinone reductase-like Zn-dependent oxidoreductase